MRPQVAEDKMPSATVLPLRCPRCGGALAGGEHDVLFWCGACGVPQEVVESRFVERPGKLARALLPGAGERLFLPVWAFRVRYESRWDDAKKGAAARLIPTLEWVYVSGFAVQNAAYFGDPGMIFTEKRVTLEPADPRERAVVAGCTRGLEGAKAYVEPRLMAIIDRRVDITGMQLRCEVTEAVLWGIPFRDEGDAIRDRILDLRIPAAAVTEMAGIRACRAGM